MSNDPAERGSPRPEDRFAGVDDLRASLGSAERQRLFALAAQLRAADPKLVAPPPFAAGPTVGLGPWPSLFVEDHGAIALFHGEDEGAYAYRSLLLAGDGDIVLTCGYRSPDFEAYCSDRLGLGRPQILSVRPDAPGRSLAIRCLNDCRSLDYIVQYAHSVGGLNIIPYMGTAAVWRLAAQIGARAGVPICVAASRPWLTRQVNDKIWFARCIADVLGESALPPSYSAHGPAMLAARLRALAQTHATVAVKLPDSASSLGNLVLDAKGLLQRDLGGLRKHLLTKLRELGWTGQFPLLASAWERPLLASPSIQVWIPHEADREPVLEGIFTQLLSGRGLSFAGAEPAQLPIPVRQGLADGAGRLSMLFQQLGYFGRCSFDTILVGDSLEEFEIHWIECNGRWGGVSTPMTLANRLLGDWRRRGLVISERSDLTAKHRDLSQVLRSLEGLMFDPSDPTGGAVLLSPSWIEAGRGYQIMVFGATQEGARASTGEVIQKLWPGDSPRGLRDLDC